MKLLSALVFVSAAITALAQDPQPLLLSDAGTLITGAYPPEEKGYAKNSDGSYLVSVNTKMPNTTGPMMDWWFGYLTNTEIFKRWHPFDHVYLEWQGPHGKSQYVGGHSLVYEKIGGSEQRIAITFRSPSVYFGDDWKTKFQDANITTAICGRVGFWLGRGWSYSASIDMGHVIHLVHNEGDGVRIRSRFWLGDIGIPVPSFLRSPFIPQFLIDGLLKHSYEEMRYLRDFLPQLYAEQNAPGSKDRWAEMVIPWTND